MNQIWHRVRPHYVLLVLATVGAAGSCEEARPLDVPGPSRSLDSHRGATARVELPTLASRLAFHEVGSSIVGGGLHHEIRAQAGVVTFVPGAARRGRIIAGAPLDFETVSIGRGGANHAVAPREQSAVDGVLEIEHDAATERWVNDEGAAEQSFVFDEAPRGQGDLVVRIHTTSACAAVTAEGLRFAGADGEPGVLYGHATFVDADGEETPVLATCDDDGIVLRVPERIVEEARYPAVLDPVVSPTFEVTTPVGRSTNGASPGMACTDATCLIAFSDDRDGVLRRYAGRLAPDGTMLDEEPVSIGGPIASGEDRTAVGALADRFVVAYRAGTNVFAQLVGSDGALLGGPVTVATGVGGGQFDLSCGATDCLVTSKQGTSLVANRVAADATVGVGFVVATPVGTIRRPAFAAGRYLVPYESASDDTLFAKRVENGIVIDTTPIVVKPDASPADDFSGIATNGTDFFVTMFDQLNRFHGTFISNDGVVLPPGAAFQMLAPENFDTAYTLFWNGTDYSVTFRNPTQPGRLKTFRISSSGAPSGVTAQLSDFGFGPGTVAAPVPSGGAVVAFEGASTVSAVEPLYGRRVDGTGQPVGTAPFLISHGPNQQMRPAAAAGGQQYLVTWFDRRLTSVYVVGARVAADGEVLDPDGILIAELSTTNTAEDLAVGGVAATWNGSSFLVTWTDNDVMRGARVGVDGTVLDSTPRVLSSISSEKYRPSVAWSGVVHLMAWRNGTNSSNDYFVRVDAQGNPLDVPGTLLGPGGAMLVAWTGQEFLIVAPSGYRTVTAAGVPNQSALVPFAGNIILRSASCSGAACWFTYFANGSLRLVPFDAQSKTLGTSTVVVTPAPSSVAAVHDGAEPVVVYGTNVLTAWTAGATIQPIDSGDGTATEPQLASLGDGSSLLTYAFRESPAGSVSRIHANVVRSDGAANGAVCAVAADCASGFCADGVCCNTACGASNEADCQACSIAAGADVDGLCAPRSSGTACRASTGDCDAAEQCDGVSPACPADTFLPDTVVCRSATDLCDVAERCSGSSASCPSDGRASAGAVCREAVGECDVPEACNGTSATCPADAAAAPGSTCSNVPNDCFRGECTGTIGATATCAAITRARGSVCRPAVGACDAAEVCDGAGSACPADMLLPAATECRAAAGACDVAEVCGGESADCPADALVAADVECRESAGACDVAESCDGENVDCPEDLAAEEDTPCGETPEGACAAPSTCAGGDSKSCELRFEAEGTSCRAPDGACDAEEVCDGASPECPDDGLLEDGEPCETPSGDEGVCNVGTCDEVESSGAGGTGGAVASSSAGAGGGPGGADATSATGSVAATTGGDHQGAGGETTPADDGDDDAGPTSRSPSGEAPSDGCSCRLTASDAPREAPVWTMLAALTVAASRRRSRRSLRSR